MTPDSTHAAGASAEHYAEAARYALTRRLLPVLRHHMVVHLQPIGMIYEVLDRRLSVKADDVAPLREGMGKINTLARSAISSCLDVVSWLAPEAGTPTQLGKGVQECMEMLASNFRFRGFVVTNHVGDTPFELSQACLREVFTSSLMAATDDVNSAVELSVKAEVLADSAVVSIHTRPGQASDFAAEMAYRKLSWDDVQALCAVHGVHLTREGSTVQLRFAPLPRALAAASA